MNTIGSGEFKNTATATSCRTPPNNSNNREFKKTTTATSCTTPPNNSNNREFKKTTTATSCTTPPNNRVKEQNNETERPKYNLVGFSVVLCKSTSNEHHN